MGKKHKAPAPEGTTEEEKAAADITAAKKTDMNAEVAAFLLNWVAFFHSKKNKEEHWRLSSVKDAFALLRTRFSKSFVKHCCTLHLTMDSNTLLVLPLAPIENFALLLTDSTENKK